MCPNPLAAAMTFGTVQTLLVTKQLLNPKKAYETWLHLIKKRPRCATT